MSKVKLDLTGLKKLRKRLEAVSSVKAQIGHFNGEIHTGVGWNDKPKSNTYAEVGYFLEKGIKKPSGGVHAVARPYLSIAFKELEEKEKVKLISAMRIILTASPVTFRRNIRKIGAIGARTVKRVMRAARSRGIAPNTATTIAIKKGKQSPFSTYPTMETGALRRNVKHRIVKTTGINAKANKRGAGTK